jgi:hypothetical protein
MPVVVALLRGTGPAIAAAPDEGLQFFFEQRLNCGADGLPKPILDRIVAASRFQ